MTVLAAATISCAAPIALMSMAGTAGAACTTAYCTSGQQVPNSLLPINPDPNTGDTVIPGTPYSSGQTVEISVPAENVLVANTNVEILECEAPNGVLPTQPSQCDPNTKSADTIHPAADGSFSISDYPIYATPDSNIGDTAGSPVCGNTVAHECVLGFFDNYNSFTSPYLVSQPFLIVPSPGDDGANPGDGTPEVPLAIGLPLLAAGIVAGSVLYRRRSARAA
jgi:hypothetical protein